MTYCYSQHEDGRYHGGFNTEAAAIDEAVSDGLTDFWTGKSKTPSQPEDYWCADDWLEHVACQDEYGGDYAMDWDDSTREQQKELEEKVRAVMADWLDRHNLRPKFFTVDELAHYQVVDGVPQRVMMAKG